MTTQDVSTVREVGGARRSAPVPYRACVLIGLGGLFAGVTGPLLSTFIPPLVRDAVGEQRTLIGVIMAIDNVLLPALLDDDKTPRLVIPALGNLNGHPHCH